MLLQDEDYDRWIHCSLDHVAGFQAKRFRGGPIEMERTSDSRVRRRRPNLTAHEKGPPRSLRGGP
jgi:hypothetical protein